MADHPVLKWWPVAVAVVAGAVAYGKLESDVSNLKDRMGKLEDRIDPSRLMRVGRGDLCLELLHQWGNVKDPSGREILMRKWGGSGCETLPAMASTFTNALQSSPPPPPPRPEPER